MLPVVYGADLAVLMQELFVLALFVDDDFVDLSVLGSLDFVDFSSMGPRPSLLRLRQSA